jgi:hypothetical protein
MINWSQWFPILVISRSPDTFTLPVALLAMNGELGSNFRGIMALAFVTTLPVAVCSARRVLSPLKASVAAPIRPAEAGTGRRTTSARSGARWRMTPVRARLAASWARESGEVMSHAATGHGCSAASRVAESDEWVRPMT